MNDPYPAICDYEGSDYQASFWERGGRAYEDGAEALALRRLLPSSGEKLLEVGAGGSAAEGAADSWRGRRLHPGVRQQAQPQGDRPLAGPAPSVEPLRSGAGRVRPTQLRFPPHGPRRWAGG